uniref:ARAD1C42768p n=1 Tax=Blastobotrys adeninivorans TaxID=409370 RepID=A0A060T488_BLAAD
MAPRENKVTYYQKYYQAKAGTPVWMRHPRSKLIVYPFYALFSVVCVAIPAYYGGRAIMGKKAEKGKW